MNNNANNPRPRILGLDLSVTGTGVCLPDGTTRLIKTDPRDGDRRLIAIANAIGDAAVVSNVDLAVVEGPVVRSASAVALGMVHGAVRMTLLNCGVPYVLVPPATLKKYATGVGNADKAQMLLAAFKRAGAEFTDDNQCDSWWLHNAALDAYGHAQFDLPKAQRECLSKVVWPAFAPAIAVP
jgi:Holliday junction resolvasome RuvABC endonuclease subunit